MAGVVGARFDHRASLLDTTRNTDDSRRAVSDEGALEQHPALILAWCRAEPGRSGEVAVFPPDAGPRVLGRGTNAAAGEERVRFFQQRPGSWQPGAPLGGSRLSRHQLSVEVTAGRLSVRNVGKLSMFVNGGRMDEASLEPGDTVRLDEEIALVCSQRPVRLARLLSLPGDAVRAFGAPDAFGLVGESPAAWTLRDRLAAAARSAHHVLLVGPPGSGKEHAARALHELSGKRRPWVTCNSALLSAESSEFDLFGNSPDYPSPGVPERPGLVGEAHHSTLFFDQVQALSETSQSQLLRVLERDGTYQRPGDAAPRRSTARIVGALTGEAALMPDFLERFTARVVVPGLDVRQEDVPLLVAALACRAARESPDTARRFFSDDRLDAPRADVRFIEALLRHEFSHHVRELERLVWVAMTSTSGGTLELTGEVEASLSSGAARGEPDRPLSADRIRAALSRHRGNQSEAARSLGLKNRYALIRLMKRYGIDPAEFRS